MITDKQIKLVWVLAKQLGIDDEGLHALVDKKTGKDSIKNLSCSEANAIITGLVVCGAQITKKRTPKRYLPGNAVEMVTQDQMQYIRYLEEKLGWHETPQRLKGFIKRIVKKERVGTKQDGIKVIIGLKSMVERNAATAAHV